MDSRRDAMALSGSGSYYLQRGISGSGHPPQPAAYHGSQPPGSAQLHPLSNSNPPFGSNPGGSSGFGSVEPSSGPVIQPRGVNVVATSSPASEPVVKRKRGRPRKYGTDGGSASGSGSVSLALSPSVSTHPGAVGANPKRGRGRPPGSGKKHQRIASIGELLPASSGMSFTPHVITVGIGEDIATKVTAFSQQGPRAICILSANGAVSTATLHQPSSSPGTVTYEGRFEILSLAASYLVTNDGSFRSRTGNLNVSLASPDGRVIGGGVGGPLIAGSPVQVIVGSFIWGATKTKNKKREQEASRVVQDTDDQQALDDTLSPGSGPPSQNIIPTSVGIWTGSRPMDMRHAHIDIDLMRG